MTEEDLWEAQLLVYPDSIKLSPDEMLDWAEHGDTYERLRRFRAVAVALSRPVYVFYRTGPWEEPGYIGCRYGVRGDQYLSGFTP